MGAEFKSDCGRILKTDAINLRHIITVAVGTNENTYPVHQSLVCASSKFFRSALKSEWVSSKVDPQTVDLSEEVPEIFEIYLHWLYFKTLPTVLMKSEANNNPEFKELAQCYVLGEKLIDIKFKNTILDALADALENQPFREFKFPGVYPINIIYRGTTENSQARRFLVDVWAYKSTDSWNSILERLPAEFILDLTKALITLRPKPRVSGRDHWKNCIADYHEK